MIEGQTPSLSLIIVDVHAENTSPHNFIRFAPYIIFDQHLNLNPQMPSPLLPLSITTIGTALLVCCVLPIDHTRVQPPHSMRMASQHINWRASCLTNGLIVVL